MSRRHRTIASVLAASALVVAALGASAPAPASKAAPKSASKPAASKAADPMAGHHHDMSSPKEADQGKFMTIVAEVMDPACFLEAGSKSIGPGHFQCAVDCVRSGQTLALYDRAADRIYFIAGELPGQNPNDPVRAYIHQKVDVSGKVYHRADAWGIVIIKVVPHAGTAAPASAPVSGGEH
jgi:hypothetical protein